MVRHIVQKALSFRLGRKAMAASAAFILLAAVGISAAQAPTASAQTPFFNPFFNNGFNNFGFNGLNNFGLNGFNNFGLNGVNNLGFTPFYPFYGYNGYNYGSAYNGYNGYNYGSAYNGYNPNVAYSPTVTSTSYGTTYMTGRSYAVSGQYCTDKTGGQVWVPTGAPADGLTCGGGATTRPY